jgi:hypothetical protein
LLNSPNREAALMAKCVIGLMIGDGRIKLDEDEEVPADLAELNEEIRLGRLGRQN